MDNTVSGGAERFEVPYLDRISTALVGIDGYDSVVGDEHLMWTSDEHYHFVSLSEFNQFNSKKSFLEGNGLHPVHPFDFYRDIFPVGSFERLGHQEDCKPNGIVQIVERGKKRKKNSRSVILTDGFEQLESCILDNDFVITSPISYYGRSRKSKNASMMHALTLDIDYVEERHIEHMLEHFDVDAHYSCIPIPTYLVNSGHGVHLYYVFEKPIPLYKQNQINLLGLKKYLIDLIWTKYNSSQPSKKECLSLFQGFRMVGSKSKLGACRVEAYKTSNYKCTFDWLAGFDRARNPSFEHFIAYGKTGLSLDEAKELYPEWYERRVVRGELKRVSDWKPKRDLYDWWFNKAMKEIEEGHRYFGIMTLAIFAAKCGISKEELESDAMELQEEFETKGKELFTVEDMKSALAAYKDEYRTFTRSAIERITGLDIPANKRNGRPQEQHLKLARGIRQIKHEMGESVSGGGRPTKLQQVKDWRSANPNGTKADCERQTGLSRHTILKWWDA